jgi:DNA-binding CsgD family transcriptional regulator
MKEIRVASLVKSGKRTKEIAEIMRISTSVIDFHRKNIRKKLGLNNTKKNLQSTLMSLS